MADLQVATGNFRTNSEIQFNSNQEQRSGAGREEELRVIGGAQILNYLLAW